MVETLRTITRTWTSERIFITSCNNKCSREVPGHSNPVPCNTLAGSLVDI